MSTPNSDAPKNNHFYTLQSQIYEEISPDVVNDMLQLFSFDVYSLLDTGFKMLFVTSIVAMKFDVLPEILEEPFFILDSVSTLVGDSVVVKRVYKSCPISFPNIVTLIYLKNTIC